MGRILLLPEAVASQVAAGEVVERPASVVKELVENSLDAGASQVEVAIRGGGAALIRVTDDGSGMDRDDALLCLERHATSKLRSGRDLAHIATLGFRGEAVPSIASVSRFRLLTREAAALAGTEVLVNGGRIETVREAGAAPGTVVEARSLFYNLPARRKFLRSPETEGAHVERQLQLLAIGHPRVGFTLRRDDRAVFQLPPAADLRERIRDLLGGAVAGELLPVVGLPMGLGRAAGGVRAIAGFIGRAGVSRASRADQIVFVNGRAVENLALSQGLREGYHTALMKGRHPLTFLFVDLDPAAVDVNVHPAKREVRFREPATVREAVAGTVRRTLAGARAEWARSFHQPGLPVGAGDEAVPPAPDEVSANPRQGLLGGVENLPPAGDGPSPDAVPAIPKDAGTTPPTAGEPVVEGGETFDPVPANFPPEPVGPGATGAPTAVSPGPGRAGSGSASPFRVLGVLGRLYVLLENDQGLVLVDQHAAHERVLFEELRRRLDAGGVPGQRLLPAVPVELGPREADWLRANTAALGRMGIAVEAFGPGGSFLLDSLPPFLSGGEPGALLREIIDAGRAAGPPAAGAPGARLRLAEEVIAKTVCRHAVKAHDRLRGPELERLITDLQACELPYCCPHGRPTMIQMSYAELERKFGRRA